MLNQDTEERNEPRNSGQTNNLTKNENRKKRDKRPEMARYQPPNSRSNIGNNTSKPSENKPPQTSSPSIPKEIKKEEIKETPKASKQEPKAPSGGLLKLNPNTINEIISKSERINLNDVNNSSDTTPENKQQIFVNSSHSNRFQALEQGSSSEFLNENLKYRTLFDPNNPDKPIYVGLQARNNFIPNKNLKIPNKPLQNSEEKKDLEKYNGDIPKQQESKSDIAIEKVKSISIKIQQLEAKLKHFIDSFESNQSVTQLLDNANPIRKQIENLCVEAIFSHLETSNNLNIDLNHWRSCFHYLIETLRKEHNSAKASSNQAHRDQLSKCLIEYIDDGVLFYKKLIENLEKKFLRFKWTYFIDLNHFDKTLEILSTPNPPAPNQLITLIKTKDMKYALMFINRLLICLGDLERYREMIFPSQTNQRDYSMARFYYLKAMCLAPKSSRAYHQLAILAIYTKRRLDACYYYFRCLEASTPLTSVRQSLNSIFEEVRIKSDSINKMIKNAIMNKEKLKKPDIVDLGAKNRVEFWYKPALNSTTPESDNDSSTDSDENDSDETKNLSDEAKLSLNELNKRFMLNYLNTIGKLFTKVGMETYDEVCSNMLKEFSELLHRSPCPLGKMRLLQINVINISIIDLIYKSSNQTNSDGFIIRSQLLECAIQLSIDMFCLIAKRFNNLLKKFKFLQSIDWNQLFPSIKVFIDWMLCNIKLWNPMPDQLSPDLGPNPIRWEIIIELFNLINQNIFNFENKEIRNDLFKIKLEEDLELAGFVPLLSLSREDYDFQNSIQINLDYLKNLNESLIENEKIKKRMQKVLMFAEYLCGLEQPLAKFDVLNKCYSRIVEANDKQKKTGEKIIPHRTISTCSSSSANDSNYNTNLEEIDQPNEMSDDDELSELKEKRRLLKAKMAEQQSQEKKIQSLLEANSQRQIELEIRPKFIVADTNCFIDHLQLIDRILSTNYYILIVPLLVINELEKLAKSISYLNDDSLEHAEYLQRNAKKSIEFLNNKFEKRERNIKAMTSQGSVLETIQFRTEEVVKPGTNDELILGCCLYYCRDNARDFMPNSKSDAIHLYRDVVLLTEDRHLKLKAHTRNVPVKDIKHFCKWSGLLSNNSNLERSNYNRPKPK